MGDKLVIGPINKGLKTDRTAFAIDNDSFPTLINAYQWRGRVKRKRGTQFLSRLQRYFDSTISSYSPFSTITLSSGSANILTGFNLQANGNIIPGTVFIDDITETISYTDDGLGNLVGTPSGNGTINYNTGIITISGGASDVINTSFFYYPSLPALGIEDLVISTSAFPGTMCFDSKYAYIQQTPFPYMTFDVSFYKNPVTGSYPGYTQKTNPTSLTWNGEDYQQFWTVNYQGSLWVTNGIDIPFTGTNIGMQFKPIVSVTVNSSGPPALVNLQITSHGLLVGDFLFINEVITTTGINFQTGYVIAIVDANNVTVEFPNATITTNGTDGIAQYLTNTAVTGKDCLRWYDGDPTNGSSSNPVFVSGNGWVNFSPPLEQSQLGYIIADEPLDVYYLVGARMIIPFKDRLLFLGPVIQTSKSGAFPLYLQDTVIYSQNGTAYYTCSYTNPVSTIDNPISPALVNLIPILVPIQQTATPSAYFEDQTGFGGFIQAGIDQPIITAAFNEDVIVVGFQKLQTRLAYTGNDLVPFAFFSINTEYGSSSTFSTITMDKGVITRGDKGYVITSQVDCQRIDLEIPDQVFEIDATNNGTERFCAVRDFINEWIYFTYSVNTPSDQSNYNFPNQTLQFNYRDNSWAIFNESYTTYGSFRKQTGFTWSTVGDIYASWNVWNDPWEAGVSQLEQPLVLGGNQQGFIMVKGVGTGEGTSIYIKSFSGNTVTSPNHCLNNGDYIIINNCIGDVSSLVNGFIFSVANVMENTFTLNPSISATSYVGGGLITRLYVPQIQTKQFPVSWDMARKTRLGPQMYLLSFTPVSEITLLIYLSQNGTSAYNTGPIVPDPESINDGLIYSTVLYTCPESTNLGLTPSNSNLQMPTANNQAQIWHRINTSLLGDTIQLGFTLSDEQMRVNYPSGPPVIISGATNANPCVLTCSSNFQVGQIVLILGVRGMFQLNGNTYQVIGVSATTVTINVNTTSFGTYTVGGTATVEAAPNATAEIEIHSIILDVQPSSLLS
jgi:hypothetical protein